MTHKNPSEPVRCKVAAIAAIAAWAAESPVQLSTDPPRVFNTPKRAAKGRRVPLSKKADVPGMVDRSGSFRVRFFISADCVIESAVVRLDGIDYYIEAARMDDLVLWLESYAAEVDSRAADTDESLVSS